ncbi:hypothetical protein AAVH_23067 [Aphelenchoides avenae]|nr:hypothetical protein AAVH_23067 [Aphelenchus avenae]
MRCYAFLAVMGVGLLLRHASSKDPRDVVNEMKKKVDSFEKDTVDFVKNLSTLAKLSGGALAVVGQVGSFLAGLYEIINKPESKEVQALKILNTYVSDEMTKLSQEVRDMAAKIVNNMVRGSYIDNIQIPMMRMEDQVKIITNPTLNWTDPHLYDNFNRTCEKTSKSSPWKVLTVGFYFC